MAASTVSTNIYFYGIWVVLASRATTSTFTKILIVKKWLFLLLALLPFFSNAQDDSCVVRISLLTCTPGEELYSTFGHSAIRVADARNNTDIIFNYGTFDFNDPNFYEKFVQGKLLYFVSIDSLHNFLWEYEYFKRGVTEQVLNLSCPEKQKMINALYENAREENKYYRYDFNYDNCTTRLRDILEKATGKPLQTKNILPAAHTTFRDLIHVYLNNGHQYWSKLGIDILLGSPLDKEVTNREAMFLPDYLMMAFDSAKINNKPLVMEKGLLLPPAVVNGSKPFFTPLLASLLLFVLILTLSILRPNGVLLRTFDVFFFLLLGLLGILLLFMWFGTNHAMCRNNFNLLWALPTHAVVAVMLFTKKQWVKLYFRFIFFYSIALLACWFLLPQEMNIALLPLLGVILVRSYYISKPTANG